MLHRLRRAVRIIICDIVDLSPVDPTPLIYRSNVGKNSLADEAIDEAGPLNGNTPPCLISVAVTPGASAAKAGTNDASVNASADASLKLANMTPPLEKRIGF
jgi:hypothetical protein